MVRAVMKTLLSDRFAPITSSIGFLQLGLDDAVEALTEWRRKLVGAVETDELDAGFPECLHALEPLTGGVRPRELLVDGSDGWTAYFDCSLRGTDAVSTVGYLSRKVGCQGLAITTVPHTVGLTGVMNGQMGSVQFEMFGPLQTEFLNYVRTIALSYDGSRWVFEADGTEQWFEDLDAYKARRVRDRFTTEMLERYCKALDLDVFAPGTYGPRAVLVRTRVEVPKDGYVMTLDEVQRWLEIVPGQVDQLVG
jgi:hypothetical protein